MRLKTLELGASAASCSVDVRPMHAVSTRLIKGSTTTMPSAGIASAATLASWLSSSASLELSESETLEAERRCCSAIARGAPGTGPHGRWQRRAAAGRPRSRAMVRTPRAGPTAPIAEMGMHRWWSGTD